MCANWANSIKASPMAPNPIFHLLNGHVFKGFEGETSLMNYMLQVNEQKLQQVIQNLTNYIYIQFATKGNYTQLNLMLNK